PGRIEGRLVAAPSAPTTHKTRYVAAGQQVLRVDEEVAAPVGAAVAERLIAAVEAELAGVDALILTDYAKGALTDSVVERAIAAARALGRPVVVDPKGRDFARYRGASVLTPNRLEAAAASGIDCIDDASSEGAGRQILSLAAA